MVLVGVGWFGLGLCVGVIADGVWGAAVSCFLFRTDMSCAAGGAGVNGVSRSALDLISEISSGLLL